MAVRPAVVHQVLQAARMVVTEGLGEGRRAFGFFIIVGNANEILADERRDPDSRDIVHCKYGHFKTYLDRRRTALMIDDCLGDRKRRKRSFLSLFEEDGAIVVDRETGQVCCGGFFVCDSSKGIGSGGVRTKAASAMATQAGGCYVLLASEEICSSAERPVPPKAAFREFNGVRDPQEIPVNGPVRACMRTLKTVHISETVRKVLQAARMVVTEGIEGRPAHGFFIIVGDANKILAADERRGRTTPYDKYSPYGRFRMDMDRRYYDLMINDCLDNSAKRVFLYLFHDDGAIVVDGQTGRVCCGGFIVNDVTSGISSGGARLQAASAMATQAGGCYVVLASEAICASAKTQLPPNATFQIFEYGREPQYFPVRESETVREFSLETWLHPLKFDADLRRHNTDFVKGTRQWVLDYVEAWRSNLHDSPCKVLLAGPGFGKTTIAARLYEKKIKVLAIHLCRHNDSLKRNPRHMITSIAYQIADVLPEFRDALRKLYETEGAATDAYSLRKTARELADCLLFNTLSAIDAPPQINRHDGRYLIIIDALDEAEHDSKNELLELVAHDFSKLPPWVAVLVTARRDVDIMRKLKPLRPTVLDAEMYKRKCDDDVHVYLRKILEGRFKDEDRLKNAIATIAAKSEGLFLYLHYIRDQLKYGDDLDALPVGLAGLYEMQLQNALGPTGLGDNNSQTRCVVESIIAAQVPPHVYNELPSLSGVPRNDVLDLLNTRLSRLLQIRDDNRVNFFHKSFVDWLTRTKPADDQPEFIVDRTAAHRRLASACGVALLRLLGEEAPRFDSDAHAVAAIKKLVEANGGVVDDSQQSHAFYEYALRWSVTHVVEAGCLEDVSLALLSSLHFLLKRAPYIDTLIADAALFLPTTELLHRALLLAKNHVRLGDAHWLAEELWQRLLCPAETREVIDLERLARDARIMARANLMFSAQREYFTPADSTLHCILEGHSLEVTGVTAFAGADGNTWVATCSDDNTVRIWDPIQGGEAIHVLEGHSSKVNGVMAFLDATGRARVASFSDDKTVRIWDPIKGGDAEHVLEGHSSKVNGVTAVADTGRRTLLASCSDDETVRIWDAVEGGEAVHVLHGHRGLVLGVTAIGRHTWVGSCSSDKTVRIWNAIEGGEAVHVLKGHMRAVTGVTAFVDTQDRKWVVSCSRDKTVRIWDPIAGGKEVKVLEGHSRIVNGVTASVDTKGHPFVASCSRDKTVRIWDPIMGGDAKYVFKGHSDDVVGVTSFVDGKGHMWVASCSLDMSVRVWDPIKGGEEISLLKGHSNEVKGVTAFVDANDRTWVTSCSSDKGVHIWDPMKGGEAVRALVGHSDKVLGVTALVDANGHTRVASCSNDATVRIWDPIQDGGAIHVLEGHSDAVESVTAFLDAKGQPLVASCSNDKMVCIWDPINGGKAVHVLEGHSDYVSGVAAFVDAKGQSWVASCSHDETVRIWDPINGGDAEHVLKGHSSRVNAVGAFVGANGETWVVSCSEDKTVRVWDPIKGEAVHVHNGHSSKVNDVKAFVDAQRRMWMTSCSDDKTVHVWDPITGTEPVRVLNGHSGGVCGVSAFADANGHPWVASCSDDTTVRIWDPIMGGDAVHVLKGHTSRVNGVTAYKDAKGYGWVASWSDDTTVRIWGPIKGGVSSFVIPLESRAMAVSIFEAGSSCGSKESAGSSGGSAQICLVIGHEDGRLSFWDHTFYCGGHRSQSWHHPQTRQSAPR